MSAELQILVVRAKAEAMAEEFEAKAARAKIGFVRRWYERSARELREHARTLGPCYDPGRERSVG